MARQNSFSEALCKFLVKISFVKEEDFFSQHDRKKKNKKGKHFLKKVVFIKRIHKMLWTRVYQTFSSANPQHTFKSLQHYNKRHFQLLML